MIKCTAICCYNYYLLENKRYIPALIQLLSFEDNRLKNITLKCFPSADAMFAFINGQIKECEELEKNRKKYN